jgi:hypothetical protein
METFMSTQALELTTVPEPPAQAALFAGKPQDVIKSAAEAATALKEVVMKQGLISNIQGKEYPRCEAWTLLGSMVGVFPVLLWTKRISLEHVDTFADSGWEARVEARTMSGAVIGAAEAQCLRSERNWKDREDFALRSMAQTRATAKALRMPLGFVMTLAGFEPTPAEEMDFSKQAPKPPSTPKNAATVTAEAKTGQPDADLKRVEARFENYGIKEGKSTKGPWRLFTCHFLTRDNEPLECGTFSASLAQNFDVLVGHVCWVTFKPGRKAGTLELVSLEPANDDGDLGPVAEGPGHENDPQVPF